MTPNSKRLVLFFTLVAALALTGCGYKYNCPKTSFSGGSGGSGGSLNAGGTVCGSGNSGGPTGPAAAFVFFLDTAVTAVETAELSTSGQFQTLTNNNPPAPPAGFLNDDMTTVNNKFLYVPYGSVNAVGGYTINNSSGALTSMANSPFALTAPGTADGIVSDPQGRFIFVGGEGTGTIAVFQIDPNSGALTEAPGSPFIFGLFSADSMAVDGNGKFLYVAQGSSTSPVWAFSIDQNTGALSPTGGGLFALNVAQLHCDPSGQYLLGVETIQDAFGSALNSGIHVFSIDQGTGAPTEISGSPFPTTAALFDFTISPNGKFVYTQGNVVGTGSILPMEGFQFDPATGNMTQLPNSPFTNLPTDLVQCKFNSGGGEMFCGHGISGTISAISVNSTTGAPAGTTIDLTASYFSYAID